MKYHEPVLLSETISGLNIDPNGIYVDATFGGGGHSREILSKLKKGRLIAFDKDKDAEQNTINDNHFQLVNKDFRQITNWLSDNNITEIDGLLADLGISSHQIDTPSRGFSTRFDKELDMRMDGDGDLTASDVINNYSESELGRIFRQYGEMRNAKRLAKMIVAARKFEKITVASQLKKVLQQFAPRGKENQFYARLFQALRIEVNDELNALKQLLNDSGSIIKKNGRIAVISYHSLEDRLVKNYFEKGKFEGELETDLYGNPQRIFNAIKRKPITPTPNEIDRNNRSRSAKLRVAQKI